MCDNPAWLDTLDRKELLKATDKRHLDEMALALRTPPYRIEYCPPFLAAKRITKKAVKKKSVKKLGSKKPFVVIRHKTLGDHIWQELYLIFCTDDPSYRIYRKKFAAAKNKGTPGIVAILTAAVAQKVGLTAAAFVPYAAAALACILKAGLKAVCERFKPIDYPALSLAVARQHLKQIGKKKPKK